MDRREAIKRVGMLMGGALSMSTIAGVLGGCQAGTTPEAYVPRTLSAEQHDLVATLSELIIPETDTPGARAAGVHEFIDRMLTDWYAETEKSQFLSGLATVDTQVLEVNGNVFMDLDTARQTAVLTAMEAEAEAWSDALARGEGDPDQPPFFHTIKQLTLFGYYTSEIGATQELHVMPLGEYRGDVPYAEIGRAWS